MTHEEIQTLFRYDSWATEKVFEALAELSDDDLAKDQGNSHGSILETAVHLVGAVEVWLLRWQGVPRQGILSTDEVKDFRALRSRWREIESDRDRYLQTLGDPELEAEQEIRSLSGNAHYHRLWQMMQHVVNHGSYHRGQIVTMLRQMDCQPPSTDLIFFYREQSRGE